TGEYGRVLELNRKLFGEKWGEPRKAYAGAMKPQYEHVTQRIRAIATQTLPAGSEALVVSRGDDDLLKLGGLQARHLHQGETGKWMGHHPAGSEEAVALLEAMR